MATKLTKGVGIVRYFCHDKPDIVATLLLGAIGFVTLGVFSRFYDGYTYHQHRYEYTVIRAEEADPVAKEKGCYN